MRRMLEANVLGQYGANFGANVGGVGCRLHDGSNSLTLEVNICQKPQFVAFPPWKHPLTRDKKTDSRPITFQRQRWQLAIRHQSFVPRLHDV